MGNYDVAIVGGGHNGLVAAAYLARAGRRAVVLEARSELGGAVASGTPFAGVPARLSRYSYLVSLLPDAVIADLGLDLELRSRRIASYTPYGDGGLLVDRTDEARTRESFRALTGDDREYGAWREFERQLAGVASVVAPTLTEPLPRAGSLRGRLDGETWTRLVERPIGEWLETAFGHDAVRGTVLTDALIGTFAEAHDPTLKQNRCLLFHVIGNGTGEWRVPVGGMGAVTTALTRAAAAAGAELRTGARVSGLLAGSDGVRVEVGGGEELTADVVLAGCAPAVLQELLGEGAEPPIGSQLKVNLVLRRLPRLRSGVDPRDGFAGTLHLAQGYRQLQEAYAGAAGGQLPDPLPCEVYCHSLTDPSILAPELQAAGWQTLTLFGLHTPPALFERDPEGVREAAGRAALRSLQDVLAEPLEDCLAHDEDGQPCVEVLTPLDLAKELTMPGGHIFHGDLSWPWLSDGAVAETPAERWGVATGHPRVLLCGSGAVRGGAVSGLGGHNAAMAVLEEG